MTLKLQQGFRTEKNNIITEDVNKIALRTNDDRKIESIDSTETYAYGMSKTQYVKKNKLNVQYKETIKKCLPLIIS